MGLSTLRPSNDELPAAIEELYRHYANQFDIDKEATLAEKRLIEWRARQLLQETYGPLLDPIRDLIKALELSPGEEVISLAIKGVDGEVRIVKIGE